MMLFRVENSPGQLLNPAGIVFSGADLTILWGGPPYRAHWSYKRYPARAIFRQRKMPSIYPQRGENLNVENRDPDFVLSNMR